MAESAILLEMKLRYTCGLHPCFACDADHITSVTPSDCQCFPYRRISCVFGLCGLGQKGFYKMLHQTSKSANDSGWQGKAYETSHENFKENL